MANNLIFNPSDKYSAIGYNKKEKCFAFEISSVKVIPMQNIFLTNKETNKTIEFQFTHKDMDGSKEDTYGWNYKSISGAKFPVTLLVIND